jgi:hypothetical protein
MTDTRIRITEALFEEKVTYTDPRAWAMGDGFLYHQAMVDVPGWRTYRSSGFRRLTRAQQNLLYWNDFVGEVVNGGLAQLYMNKPDIIDDVRAAIHAFDWPELSEQLHAAHFAYIAPSKDAVQWTKQVRRQEKEKEKTLLKAWRAGINEYDPLPIWLIDFWREHGRGPFNSEKARQAWRRHYRNHPPDQDMLWVLAAQQGATITRQTPEERDFNKWFYRDETRAQSREYVPRFLRANKDQLAVIVG